MSSTSGRGRSSLKSASSTSGPSTEDEGASGRAILAVFVAMLVIAQQLAGKAVRDASFLSELEAESLPAAMMSASVLSVLAVVATAQLFRRYPPARLLPVFFAVSAAWFGAEWALANSLPKVVAVSLYIHTTSLGAVLVSGFWSVVNEAFDPHTAKRVIGRIGGGATLGGVLGGIAAWQGGSHLSLEAMVAALAISNVACGTMVSRLKSQVVSRAEEEPNSSTKEPGVLSVLDETPYLWHLALLVAASALGAAAFDYVLKARASDHFGGEKELVSFFSLFYLGVGVATFLCQQLFTNTVVNRLGLTPAVASMPAAVAGLSVVAIFDGSLWSAVALRGGAAALESSIYRSGYELLYTPLPPDKKRPTKTLIDVGCDKLGAAVGSGLTLVIVQVIRGPAQVILLGLSLACALAGLGVARWLRKGYVGSLADSLRSGSIGTVDLPSAASRSVLDETLVADRQALLERLEAGRGRRPEPLIPRRRKIVRRSAEGQPMGLEPSQGWDPASDPLPAALAALRSSDERSAKRVFRSFHPLPTELVVPALAWLRSPEIGEVARVSLARVAPAHLGLLADELLGGRGGVERRRDVVGLLERVATERSALLLVAALEDEHFELRLRCAVALRNVTARNLGLELDAEPLVEAALARIREARMSGALLPLAPPHEAGQTLAYVLLLASCFLPAEPLRLAVEALGDELAARRGTGLEYLENVLPEALSEALEPFSSRRDVAGFAAQLEEALTRDPDADYD